jgi:putative ABC transport system permease protein
VNNRTRAPRVAIWLLTMRLSPEWRDFVIGDLEEEFASRACDSRAVARVWFWRQTAHCLIAPPPIRRRAVTERAQGDSTMLTFFSDLRHAFRLMWRTPSFAVAVIGVLALGIAANTAVFSIVNAVLLRPLPLEEPDRLVRLFTRLPSGGPFELSPGKFYDWQRDARSFERMALYSCCGFRELALTGTGTARAVKAIAVSTGFFDVVGVPPALGRTFRPEEDTPDGRHVVVLSDRFWKIAFDSNPDAIGRTMWLGDEAYTVVGVMPLGAVVPSWTAMASDVWIPLALTDQQRTSRGNHFLYGVARMRDGVNLSGAQAEMNEISARLAREFPKSDDGWGATLVPVQEAIVGSSHTMLLMLLGAVGLVLLIGCANVGNLLLTRALSRRKEIAIRAALGAGRIRVFRQLLTETLLLAVIGGALGILLGYGMLTVAGSLLAADVPRADEISMDARVLLFACSLSIFTGALAGTLPALRVMRFDLNGVLKEGGRGDDGIAVGTRRVLIASEVAVSLVLLMGAGVMAQSLLNLRHGETGFNPDNVLTMRVRLIGARYPEPAKRSAFFQAALQRIRALPGVEAAGTIDDLPFADGSSQTLYPEGEPAPGGPAGVQVRQISPGYLRVMGIPILRGRDVFESDTEVLLVSQDAAKLFWGETDPIGRRATLPALSQTLLRQVVGVVGDVKQRNLIESSTPTVYFYTRSPYGRATLTIRTSVPPATLALPTIAALREIDPEQPVTAVRTMAQVRDEKLTSQRLSAGFLAVFAAMALLLAGVGVHSLLSHIVRGRSREIGIRTALGARTGDILRLVVVEGMIPVLAGLAVGAVAALASARVLKTLVFGVSASDPLTLAAVGATLALAALVASVVPAYRAVRLDPVKVLRAE